MSSANAADSPSSWLPESWAYVPASHGFDEALAEDDTVRPHWRRFLDAMQPMSMLELSRRWSQAQRVIRENGVTYNVYGDPRGADRPWQLDPLPILVSAEEWAATEAGLVQRARLLDAILSDLYGPQRLIRERVMPPELVLANPAFLRPLFGVHVADNVRLHLYSADLARDGEGRFTVLGDRTQAPSGAGYALENRIVISQLLPQVFRDCRIERLALFFRAVREGLRQSARRRSDSPRVVLLTPGPYNETYFEHAYLARYLGYTLVEGGDLTVRDRSLYLKTLGGLERVDVVLRRLDDSYADPLSLRADSSLGIAGLVHAVRAGNVTVANSLGSGLIEMPALLAFLPQLCRALLNEDLELPSVPTYWCGDEQGRRFVLEHLSNLVIKPAVPGSGLAEPVFGGDLSHAELEALKDRILARPGSYVGQERLPLSTAPAFTGDSVQSRHLTLRTFLARRGNGYVVMPGGLTRIGSSKDSLVVSMQRGGGSKDTWVLARGEPNQISLLPQPGVRVDIVRSGGDLPSRVADNLFWIGRYVERAEATTRLFRSLLVRRADDSVGRGAELSVLIFALEDNMELLRGAIGKGSSSVEAELSRLLLSPEPARTPAAGIAAGYRATSVVRDRVAVDTWRVLNQLSATVEQARGRSTFDLTDALEIVASLMLGFSAFSGLVMENMTHGPGWRFADIGRRIERGSFMVRFLRSTLVSGQDPAVLDSVLEVADSAMTYRSRYPGTLTPEPLLDLLLQDETNPRSVAYQLAVIEDHVARLPRAVARPVLAPEAKTILHALSAVRLADLDQLARLDANGKRPLLEDLLNQLDTDLPLFADQLSLSYLAHAQSSFSVGSPAERA